MILGTIYNGIAEGIDLANTRWWEAGSVKIGLEYRHLDVERIAAGDPDGFAAAVAIGHTPRSTEGWSVHVVGTDDLHEYLRFDCLGQDPHYHYLHRVSPGEPMVNHFVPFDRTACGDMLHWTLGRLRESLAPMLGEAKGQALAAGIDQAAIARGTLEIARLTA